MFQNSNMRNRDKNFDETSSASLIKIQAISGLVFSIFTTVHLVHQGVAVFGPGPYNEALDILRAVYKTHLFEIFGIHLPYAVHVLSGALRIWRRSERRIKTGSKIVEDRWRTVHRYSGYVMLLGVSPHVISSNLPRWLSLNDTTFSTMAWLFSLNQWIVPPLHVALAIGSVVHMTIGIWRSIHIIWPARPGKVPLSDTTPEELVPEENSFSALLNPTSTSFKVIIALLSCCSVFGIIAMSGKMYSLRGIERDFLRNSYAWHRIGEFLGVTSTSRFLHAVKH